MSGLPCSLPGDLLNQGITFISPVSLALVGFSLPLIPPGEPHSKYKNVNRYNLFCGEVEGVF